ncbi:MAG: lipopolysaccharide kinase InaA family protein, partial [Planctomycetota bacterium]
PEVLAVLRDGAFPRRSILVMRRVAGALPLEGAMTALPPAFVRAAAERAGRALRRMHDRGLRHRDLKRDNVLFDLADGAPWFLDLDGVREAGVGFDAGRRARDLANFAGSFLDPARTWTGWLLRALGAYAGAASPPGFARLVARLAKERRERRRARLA